MISFCKEKWLNALKKGREKRNTNKHYQEMNKTVQDQKLEIESIKKIQTEKTSEMEI